MADGRKEGFHTVETNTQELQEKIRKHRLKILRRVLIVLGILLVLAGAFSIYTQMRRYTKYEVRTTVERADSAATQYEDYEGGILKYNNDGISYVDSEENMVWTQAYEMQNPMVDICESYIAVADRQGTQIFVLNKSGMQGQIKTNMPIKAICTAGQGTVAVLMEEDGTSYLQMYNRSGERLASGELHAENSGYPLGIALSSDANKLAVSMLDISQGEAKTTIAFYNFGSVGQNEIDNIVGSYTYQKTIIPEIHFLSRDRMIAFGDSKIIIFEGTQKPEEKTKIDIKKEIKSIFFDKDYFGFVFGKGDTNDTHKLQLYDMKGRKRLEKDFSLAYSKIELLENHEICIMSENACVIYTVRGVEKFKYEFDSSLYKIISGELSRNYTFILYGVTEKVRLK